MRNLSMFHVKPGYSISQHGALDKVNSRWHHAFHRPPENGLRRGKAPVIWAGVKCKAWPPPLCPEFSAGPDYRGFFMRTAIWHNPSGVHHGLS